MLKQIVVFFILSCVCKGVKYTVCTDDDGKQLSLPVTVDTVTLEPETPQVAQDAVFTILGKSDVAVAKHSNAELELGVSFDLGAAGIIPAYTDTDDLCKWLKCPVSKGGSFKLVYKEELPSITPPGNYVMTMKGYQDKEVLFCIDVKFSIALGGVFEF